MTLAVPGKLKLRDALGPLSGPPVRWIGRPSFCLGSSLLDPGTETLDVVPGRWEREVEGSWEIGGGEPPISSLYSFALNAYRAREFSSE